MPVRTFDEIESTKPQIRGFEEIPVLAAQIPGTVRFPAVPPEEIQEFRVARKPTFGEKWKEYFFPPAKEGRWTKPDRHEKFFNATKWPAKTAINALGSVINRMNKFLTEVSPVPEIMKITATLDPTALKDILPSIWESRRVFSPVPGSAKELKTFGDAMAKDWYEPLAREEPPWWYTPAMDIAFETLLISGGAAQRASRVAKSTFTNAKLTSAEIKAAKRIFSTKVIAKMQPAQVRATLAKESAVIILSKAEKAQLLRRGYKPIQIQNMTPLEAYQVIDDIPKAEVITKPAKFLTLRQIDKLPPRAVPISKVELNQLKKLNWPAKEILRLHPNDARVIIQRNIIRPIGKLPERIIIRPAVREFLPDPLPSGLPAATKRAVDRLTTGIKRAKRLHPQKERMISLEKSRRVAVAQQIREAQKGERAVLASRGPLRGEYSVPSFTAPDISPIDRYYLFESLRTSKMPFFRYNNTGEALLKILRGDMPARAETALLERHFGSGLARAILQKRSLGLKAWQNTLDILNIPRATLASWDLSFPLRQGIMLLPGHPKQWAVSFGQMMKSARPGHKGKEYARYLEDMAESSRYSTLRNRSGLDITQWGLTDITAREEPFLSSWAELIPGVKWSNRTFTTMSNQLRINVFDDVARNWERAGMSWAANPEEYTRLAAFLNHATGRGTIPAKYAGITPELNAAFFSPRYQISRPQVVHDAFISLKLPAARKVIVGDLVKYVGTGSAALWLLNEVPGVEVETDPRSSDFGKVKYRNTRYDFWAGNAQIARLVAQVSSGQTKANEKLHNINQKEVIERYIRTKLSPPAGLVWDVLEGQTFMGDEMTLEPTFLARDIPSRVAPMVMQDIYDAVRFQGMDGVLPITSTTAFFGLGVGTWEPSKWELLRREQDSLANTTYGKEWDSLNEIQQKLLQRDNKLLDNLKREAAYERTVFPYLEEIKKDQLVAGLDVEGGLLKGTQKELARLKIRVGSLPRTFGDWTLNDERYEKYKTLLTKELQLLLSKAMKEEGWEVRPDEEKTNFIEKAIEVAKTRARTLIRKEARR